MEFSVPLLTYSRIFKVALPIIAANALLPLQGLIDTAIMGHLDTSNYLSALGLASSVFALLYASLNFLQYATSGLSAQALGAKDFPRLARTLLRALLIATIIGIVFILIQNPLIRLAQWYFHGSIYTELLMADYMHIRLFGAVGELGVFCLIGWFAGQSLGKYLLYQQAVLTMSNIALSLFFVYGLGMKISGVALGTVLANYLALGVGLYLVQERLAGLGLSLWRMDWLRVFNAIEMKKLLGLNRDLFIRTLIMALCLSWFQRLASGLGESYVAANVILLWLLTLAAYVLDGIAVTAEGFTGQAIGANNTTQLHAVITKTALTGVAMASVITLVYALFLPQYIQLMTSLSAVQAIAEQYRWWAILLPLAGVGGYLLDGYYFGATAAKPLRNAMLIIGATTIPVSMLLTQLWGNMGIWLGVYIFLLLRLLLLAPNLSNTLSRQR